MVSQYSLGNSTVQHTDNSNESESFRPRKRKDMFVENSYVIVKTWSKGPSAGTGNLLMNITEVMEVSNSHDLTPVRCEMYTELERCGRNR